MLRPILRAACAALLLPLALGQVTAEAGFVATGVLDLAGDRAYASLSDGGYVSFDGLAFERYDATGALLQTYGTLGGFVFPSFVEVDAAEAFAYAGESSNGDIFAIDLAAGTVAPRVNLPFNFDLAFDASPGLAYVSASLGGFGAGNDILRLDLASGVATPVAHVDGPSGPLAVGTGGDLYYVTIYEGVDWPPPLGDEDLIRWTDAQLDSGATLSEADAAYLTPDLDGGSSLELDPRSGDLFLAHTNAHGLAHEVLRIASDGQVLGEVGRAYTWIANLEVESGPGPATLAPFQPPGARIRVQNTDFGGPLRERVTLEPARARARLAGPASGQSGPATVTIEGALPGGSVALMLARSSAVLPQELALDLGWGAPTFLAFDPGDVLRRSPLLPVDAGGVASLTFFQSAAWEGAIALQAVLHDAQGAPIGTSAHVVND